MILIVVAGLILIPIGYAVLGGFKSNGQLVGDPVSVIPSPWVFSNYTDVLFGANSGAFWREVLNSLIVAVIAVTATVVPASLAAFVFARIAFRGREAMYTLFVFGLLFPSAVAILPLYILVRQLGLSGNLLGVALPQAAFALPLTIIILRPFFRSIPVELEDAARIDGCSSFGFFWRVLLPLARPALATVSVLAIVTTWNAFLLPLILLNGEDQWTLPLGVMNFSGQVHLRPGPHPRLHRRGDRPGDPLLRRRGAADRRRPDGGLGEGLMATTQTSYRDAALSIDERVADLLGRMTIEEKVAQLGSVWSFEIVGIGTLNRERAGGAHRTRHRPDHPAWPGRPTWAPPRSPRWPTRSSAT